MSLMPKRPASGYTLIELLVVVTLTAILMVSIVGLFVTMIRGGGRAQALARVKEEADYTITTLERLLRYARDACDADTTSSPNSQLTFTHLDGSLVGIRYVGGVGGVIYVDDPTPRQMTSNEVDVSEFDIQCKNNSPALDRVRITFSMSDLEGLVNEEFTATVTIRNSGT